MIFVTLGTWDMPFVRPLAEIEGAAARGLLRQPIVVQSGTTPYASSHMRIVPFFSQDEMERMYEQADLIICQAGVGSIMLGLQKQKRIIAIARRRHLDEHVDDHQLEILRAFADSGAILAWRGDGDLEEVLRRRAAFVPSGYAFKREQISDEILRFLGAHVAM
jgi:UDP-N-acetylglucosamine transferase subunit ALG13